MPYIFNPPISMDVPTILPETRGLQRRLFRHYQPRARGRSVVRVGATYRTFDVPDGDLLIASGNRDGIDFFIGGHEYLVSDAIAAALTAAGYGASLTVAPVDPSGTWGQMASFFWGEVAGYQWEVTP